MRLFYDLLWVGHCARYSDCDTMNPGWNRVETEDNSAMYHAVRNTH